MPQVLVGFRSELGQVQGIQGDLRAPDGLHQSHFKGVGDGHDLAGGLHLGAQVTLGVDELIEGPLGELHRHVVQGGLEGGVGLAGDRVLDLVQGVADGDLGGHLGDGIAGGLGSQGGGTGHTGVDLDDGVFKGGGMQGKLAVAAAFYPQLVDDVQGSGAQHLVLFIGQGDGGGDHDRVAGMHAHRVQVLHRAHGDGVALAVPHDFKLDLFPAGNGLFHQDLGDGGQRQAVGSGFPQLLLVAHNAAAGAAQGEGGTDDDRVADLHGKGLGVLHSGHHFGGDAGLANLLHGVLEDLPVLGLVNGFGGSAQQPHVVLFQKALLGQLHGQGQAGLAAEPRQDAVGLLFLDDPLDGGQGQGLDVDLVRHSLVGHDGGGVGVYQHNLDAVVPQGPAGLGAGVIKFRGLADHNGAGTDD